MKKLLFAAALFAAPSGYATAADLIIDEPAIGAASGSSIYFELLGGASLPGILDDEGNEYDLPAGGAVAGVLGFGTGIEGLSVEADLFLTQREYWGGDYVLTTGTAMANLRYTASLSDGFGIYGAVGLGGMYLHDEDVDNGTVYLDAWGPAYQLKAGITAKVAEQISLVGEIRYANSFGAVEDDDGDWERSGTTAVLVGLHFGF